MLDEASVQFLFDRAREYLYARQALCQERFQMGRFRLWQVDAETSTLVFGSGSGKKVSASFDEIGSLSVEQGTGTWSWAEGARDGELVNTISFVRDFGTAKGIARLSGSGWRASEADAWEMAAVAAYLLHAEGVHCQVFEAGAVQRFYALSDVHWVD